jgi:PAS domain S-box-containing protein
MDSPIYAFTLKRDGTILSLNRTSKGNPLDEIVGTNVFSHASPEHQEIMKEALERVFQTGEATSYEILGPGPEIHDNQWYETILIPNISGDRVETVTMIGRDITEHKRAEVQLKSLASQLSLAEERERRRIAIELHDNVGQILATAKMKLGGIERQLGGNEIKEEVGQMKQLCERAIAFTRSLTLLQPL